jgi:hypothetical protein
MSDLGTFVPKTLVRMRSLGIQDRYRIWTLLGLGKNWKHDFICNRKEKRGKNQETRAEKQEVELFVVRFLCVYAPLRAKRRKRPIYQQAGKNQAD